MTNPGDILSALIFQVTGEMPCDLCNQHITEMNDRGWLWCWTNRTLISSWLAEEAKNRGYDVNGTELRHLVVSAFRKILTDRKALTQRLAFLRKIGMASFLVRKTSTSIVTYRVEATDRIEAQEKAKSGGKSLEIASGPTSNEQFSVEDDKVGAAPVPAASK